MMKKQALDAAQKMLEESFKECEPEGGGHIARRSTVAAWGDITRALQRRYAGVDAESCPYAVLTKKVKNKRAYRAVVSTLPIQLSIQPETSPDGRLWWAP